MGAACLAVTTDRPGTILCDCLQFLADQSLDRSDQRRVAEFFRDPDKAETARRSTRPDDRAFWARYTDFAVNAETLCHE